MAGREALFTDACVNGHLVDALVLRGWDVMRAIDVYPEKTPDPVVFERTAREGRVFVTNDCRNMEGQPKYSVPQRQ